MFCSCPTTSPIFAAVMHSLASFELNISFAAWILPPAMRFLFYISMFTPTPRPPILVFLCSAFDSLLVWMTEAMSSLCVSPLVRSPSPWSSACGFLNKVQSITCAISLMIGFREIVEFSFSNWPYKSNSELKQSFYCKKKAFASRIGALQ